MNTPDRLWQADARFRRKKCLCRFKRQGFSEEIARCKCGHFWKADKYFPFKWKPLSRRKAHKIFMASVHEEINRLERVS